MSEVPNEAVAGFQKALKKERERCNSGSASSGGSGSPITGPMAMPSELDAYDFVLDGLDEDKDAESGESVRKLKLTRQSSEDVPRLAQSSAAELKAPQGFRRDYLQRKADAQGLPQDSRPEAWQQSFIGSLGPLIRCGYYENYLGIEGQPLLRPLPKDRLGFSTATFALLKSIIGSGVALLPLGCAQAGWLFCIAALTVVAFMNVLSIDRLVRCSEIAKVPGYADIALLAGGWPAKLALQVSIVLNQIGGCIGYMIFVAKEAQHLGLSFQYGILIQLVFALPIFQVRTYKKLEYSTLAATIFLFVGLLSVLASAACTILSQGVDPGIVDYNPKSCGIFLGLAFLSFEGAPNFLPIRNHMAERKHFRSAISSVMFMTLVIFLVMSLSCYFAYGPEVKAPVLLSLPKNPWSQLVEAIFSASVFLSLPLCYLPSAEITEIWVFGAERSSDGHKASGLRIGETLFIAGVALIAGPFYESFMALVGVFAAIPLQSIYPPFFHLLLCSSGPTEAAIDITLLIFAVVSMVFTVMHL